MARSQPGDLPPRHRHSDSTDMNMLKGHGAHSQTGALADGTCVSESKGTIHDPLSLEYETQLLMVNRDSSVFLTDNEPFQDMTVSRDLDSTPTAIILARVTSPYPALSNPTNASQKTRPKPQRSSKPLNKIDTQASHGMLATLDL
ncbi:RmlC-like cupin domain-containing protein [Penicillium brevicompactum]